MVPYDRFHTFVMIQNERTCYMINVFVVVVKNSDNKYVYLNLHISNSSNNGKCIRVVDIVIDIRKIMFSCDHYMVI